MGLLMARSPRLGPDPSGATENFAVVNILKIEIVPRYGRLLFTMRNKVMDIHIDLIESQTADNEV